MQIPLVDLKAQYASIKSEIDNAIQNVVNSSEFILGKQVASFEEEFAQAVGANGAVGVSSGTAALSLALKVAGVGLGDEVITTAFTFIATSEVISNGGAKPVFVDIDPKTYNLDPQKVEDAITPRTKAIIPVHLYGHPAEMDQLADISRRHSLWLIEDAAQAHGAEYEGKRCGSIGHLACFSFYPGKNLGAYGDAGAVTSNDRSLLDKVRMLRDHGRKTKYEHEELGFSERMDGLQGAVLRAKLPHLEEWTQARRDHARTYSELLADIERLDRPWESPKVRHVYHLYVIRVPRRDEVLAYLKSNGISAGIHYPIPLHRQPAYLKRGYGDVVLPVSEKVAAEVLSLPLYPELNQEQIGYVVQSIKEVMN